MQGLDAAHGRAHPQYEHMFVAARVKEQAAWESPTEILCDQSVHMHWCSDRWGSSAGGPE